MTDKETFARAMRLKATELAIVAAEMVKLERIWTARFYGDNLSDEDVRSQGVTANDLALMVNMANSLQSFLGNEEVAPGDRATILHRLRTDA